MTQRFQYYQELFLIETQVFGIEGKLVDLESISEPPINYIYVGIDYTCPVDKQKEYAKKIPASKSSITIHGRDHAYIVGDNDDEFIEKILASLQDYN